MATSDQGQTIRLSDYTKPEFTTDHVDLSFEIHEYAPAQITSKVVYKRTNEGQGASKLVLDAQNPNVAEGDNSGKEPYIEDVFLGKQRLIPDIDYTFDNEKQKLTIHVDPNQSEFDITIKTLVKPELNTELSGLYQAGGVFCTQCESEGFRRITPFLDRPDVMATYRTEVIADPNTTGDALLSNGNLEKSETLFDGRIKNTWFDPQPKPSYLFALVNGDLEYIEDNYVTMSGRDVTLRIYTEKGQKQRAAFAMERLKVSMEWDEKVYGREYDLDLFNVVAVSNFTFGAMENKSLNIFAAKYIFADPATETDADFFGVDRVVAHEYFHNWTGNRVTLENWFHIALKEGFTVLRDQQYSQDVGDFDLERIDQVSMLRARQFPADDSPLAFPVLPKEVDSITNIYGATTYNKAAEVLRMIRSMIGEKDFRKASDLYFDRHDGQAVRIEDLVQCYEEVSGYPFASGQFMNWYHQSGRPRVNVTREYDAKTKTLKLYFEQDTPPNEDQPHKDPFVIPVRLNFIDTKTGRQVVANDTIVTLTKAKETFEFKNIPDTAVPSLLRSFSAPVDLSTDLSVDEYTALMAFDTDGFNRWDAGQRVMMDEILRQIKYIERYGKPDTISPALIDALKETKSASDGMRAKLLTLPSVGSIETVLGGKNINPSIVAQATGALQSGIAKGMDQELNDLYVKRHNPGAAYHYDVKDIGERSLKNKALSLLAFGGHAGQQVIDTALDQYDQASHMTDMMGALAALNASSSKQRADAFAAYKAQFVGDITVMQRWFTLQAQQKDAQAAIDTVREIMTNDRSFDPKIAHNWLALIGAFSSNYAAFHKGDGQGYELVADGVLATDQYNSAIAARLSEVLCTWPKYASPHQDKMYQALKRLASTPGISSNVKANVMKGLTKADAAKLQKGSGAAPGPKP
jgi:aminopeptidase N